MFSGVAPSPRYEGERANYRVDRVKRPVSAPVNARDVQPRLVHENPADEIRGLGKRKIPATLQRPTRSTNVRVVYARLLHQPDSGAGRFQMHDGDVVFVGRSTTFVGPRHSNPSSSAVVGASVDRFARVATWRQVNDMLERPENKLDPKDAQLGGRMAIARNEWHHMMKQRLSSVESDAVLMREGTTARTTQKTKDKRVGEYLTELSTGMQRDIRRAGGEAKLAQSLASRGKGLPIEPTVDWLAVPALRHWTPDGVLLNTDRVKEVISELLPAAADNELLLNVVVQGPCPLRNDKHAKDTQFFQQDVKASDSLYLCIVHKIDSESGVVSFKLKPCSGGQMQTLLDFTERNASAISLLGEVEESDGSTFSAQDLLHTVAAWRIGRVVDSQLVTNVLQRQLGLNVSVELLTSDVLWASLSHSDKSASSVREAYKARLGGTLRMTFGMAILPKAAPKATPNVVPRPEQKSFLLDVYQRYVWPGLERAAAMAYTAMKRTRLDMPTLKKLGSRSQIMKGATTQGTVLSVAIGGIHHEFAEMSPLVQQSMRDMHPSALDFGFWRSYDKAMASGLSMENAEVACSMLSDLTHPSYGDAFGALLMSICNRIKDAGVYKAESEGGLHFDLRKRPPRGGASDGTVVLEDMDLSNEMQIIEGSQEDKLCAVSEALNFLFRAPPEEMWRQSQDRKSWSRTSRDEEQWGPRQAAWNFYTRVVTTVAAGTSTQSVWVAMMIGILVFGVLAVVAMTQSEQQQWLQGADNPSTPVPWRWSKELVVVHDTDSKAQTTPFTLSGEIATAVLEWVRVTSDGAKQAVLAHVLKYPVDAGPDARQSPLAELPANPLANATANDASYPLVSMDDVNDNGVAVSPWRFWHQQAFVGVLWVAHAVMFHGER